MIPRLVTKVLCFGITFEQLFKLVIGFPQIRHLFEGFNPMFRKPSDFIVSQHVGTFRALKIAPPRIQDLFEHRIHLGILVNGESGRRSHSPIENGVDGHTDQTDRVSSVGPCGRSGNNVVEDREHVVKVSDLVVFSTWIFEILFAFWDLGAGMSQES